jgi:hypothetical protein
LASEESTEVARVATPVTMPSFETSPRQPTLALESPEL